MFKIIIFLFLLSSNTYSAKFRLPPENPVPENFDQFIFDNSLKTIIMTNLKELKKVNKNICLASDCKYFFESPDIVKIYINNEIIIHKLKMKN